MLHSTASMAKIETPITASDTYKPPPNDIELFHAQRIKQMSFKRNLPRKYYGIVLSFQ